MDLLFKRYAGPFLLLDEMIETGRLAEFVCEFVNIVNAETEEKSLWEFFLHKVFDKSYYEFVEETKHMSETTKLVDFETAIKESYSILENFVPE